MKLLKPICAALLLASAFAVNARSAGASGYAILNYTLTDLKTSDGIAPAVTFLNGTVPYKTSGSTYVFNQPNLYANSFANTTYGASYNPNFMGDTKSATSTFSVQTLSTAETWENLYGSAVVRNNNNVSGRLGTLSAVANLGSVAEYDTGYDAQGTATFARGFTLTPYTSITFTLNPRLLATTAGYTDGYLSANSYATLGTGVIGTGGVYTLAFSNVGASVVDANGTSLYDTSFARTVANNAATSLGGAFYSSLSLESFNGQDAPQLMGLMMFNSSVAAVPEPGSVAMFFAGIPLIAFLARRRRTMH